MTSMKTNLDSRSKTSKFLEVKAQDLFYFECTTCKGQALAANGALLLPAPNDPMGLLGLKKHDVDFLYCHDCDILENMKQSSVDFEDRSGQALPSPIKNESKAKMDFRNKIVTRLASNKPK